MRRADLVLDASALVRGLLGEGDAVEIVGRIARGDVHGHAPDLVGPEAANALLRLVRADALTLRDARRQIDEVARLPLERHPSARQLAAAFELARGSGLSVYDAVYAVLAEALDAPLVTADRGLAAAVPQAVLV